MSLAAVLEPTATPGSALSGADLTAEVAMRWACTPARWSTTVRHVEGERWYLPLFEDEHVCGWLITWAPGTSLDLHDHGGAVGSLAVVGGTLTERFRDRRRVEPFATRELTAGSMVTFGADHVHEVTNLGTEPAVSIHVYAPSLSGMTFYEEDPHAAAIRPTRAETVERARAMSTRATSTRVPVPSTPQPTALTTAFLNGFR